MGATKAKKDTTVNLGGAPTLYKEVYGAQAFKLCLLGATDKDLADFFEVSEATINNWKLAQPEFLESIREGKKSADMEVVASLYKSTQDRIVVKQMPFKTKVVEWIDGKRCERESIEIVEVEDIVAADFRAQQFWLKNRTTNWKDKQDIDHTTAGQPIIVSLGSGVKPTDD